MNATFDSGPVIGEIEMKASQWPTSAGCEDKKPKNLVARLSTGVALVISGFLFIAGSTIFFLWGSEIWKFVQDFASFVGS
jgi:hypothetical protein